MSFLAPTGTQWRTPQYGKSVIVSTWRGMIRVQAWPRKRGRAKSELEQIRRDQFAVIQHMVKYIHPRETIHESEALANYNRKHRGQRGSAAIRLRDWQTQRLYGRGLVFDVQGLATLYPPAIKRDASHILDHCTSIEGSILQRADEGWEEIPLGNTDDVLTAGPVGTQNQWQPL